MASIQQVQTERVLTAIAQRLYSTGVNPTLNEILSRVSQYFAAFPAGLPLPFPLDRFQGQLVSDTNTFNLILAHLAANVDVLYEVCLDQVDEMMMMSTILQADLDRLTVRRKRVEAQIDDLLLSLYNTDGYYYSVSDVFSDTSLTDLNITTAFVDTVLDHVVLPTVSSLSHIVGASLVGNPAVQAWANLSGVLQPTTFTTISPFSFATNGATNTVWEIQVVTQTPTEVVVQLSIPLSAGNNPVSISRADFDPYGLVAVQAFAEVGLVVPTTGVLQYAQFGRGIQTSLNRMAFIDTLVKASSFRFTLRKTDYDFKETSSGVVQYHYVFGAKDVIFTEQVYDNNATFVSLPLQISSDLVKDMVIDAISLASVSTAPQDTTLRFYVANDPMVSATPSLGDFNWQPIDPIGAQGQNATSVVRFDGSQAFQRYITAMPAAGDLQLVPLDDSNPDITLRNPSPTIIPGVDTYVLARGFTDIPLSGSLSLEAGINSTRIFWTPYHAAAAQDLTYWGGVITSDSPVQATRQYGRIDTGNGFFYGGDVGRNGISVYVETYLYLNSLLDPMLLRINKSDSNSQTWTVRTFLNGTPISYLPGRNTDTFAVGGQTPADGALVPFAFRQGLNHIAVAINIPSPAMTSGISNPYLGILELPTDQPLFGLGTIKLDDWSYVSLFDMAYNETGQPTTFTILPDGTIISRSIASTNYRLSYNQATSTGPAGIRLRADLSRSVANMNVTPTLSSYRLRFSYGTQTP